MSVDRESMSSARRSFLSRISGGAAAFGFMGGAGLSPRAAAGTFQAAKHPQDDWMELPGTHRLMLDTTSSDAVNIGRRFVENFFAANKSGYGVEGSDLAVVMILRHRATAFGYADAMWGKYGAALSEAVEFVDPKTKQPPTTNVYNTGEFAFDSLVRRGVHFAVCGRATHHLADVLAKKAGGDADAVYRDLTANLIGNAHIVPAGIVALSRLQERGYTVAYVG